MDVDEAEVEMQVTPAPDEQPLLVDEQPALATHLVAAHFVPFPFTPDVRNAIFARRALMSDELVFDLLLEQASIAAPHTLFPPDSPDALRALIDAIAQCPWDALKKSSLLFYLLSHVSPRLAAEHAALWALPAQFVHLAHACFLLDAGAPPDLAHAVALLADARIVQDLSSKILHTLTLAPQPAAARLVRTYVRTAQPVLDEYDDLAIYLRALLQSSLAAAWSFQRTFAESTPLRNQLFRTVLDACLIPPNPAVLPHLLSLPLTTFEFSLLQAYALAPPDALAPAAHAILQDLLTVRLLHSGKYSDAVRLARAFDTLNATKLRTGTETGSTAAAAAAVHAAAEDRQQMMRDVLAVVPDVQRRQLEHELAEERAADGDAAPALGASWASVGSDVAMSWESLGASGGAERAPARDGRLEGSPAPPKAAGRTSAPNTPFGLFASPAGAGAAQKRKISAHAQAATHAFGTPTPGRASPAVLSATPTPGRARPPVLPTIPTPGLDASVAAAAAAPFLFQGFRPPLRPGVAQNGAGHAPASPFAGLASPARFGFGRPAQAVSEDLFAAPAPARGGGEAPAAEAEADVVLVESDDPDSFVLRRPRRRRTASHPPQHAAGPDADTDMGDAGRAPLFGREAGPARTSSRPQAQTQTQTQGRVLPGGLTSFETMGVGAHAHAPHHDAAQPPPPPPPDAATGSGPARKPSPQTQTPTQTRVLPAGLTSVQPAGPRRAAPAHAHPRRTPSPPRARRDGAQSGTQRRRIPGALFEDEVEGEGADDAAAQEHEHGREHEHERGQEQEQEHNGRSEAQDRVPPLPARRTTRASRTSSAADSDDDDRVAPPQRTSLRRSSRLSSEPSAASASAPQKQEKEKRPALRSGRSSAAAPRKRRNADDA